MVVQSPRAKLLERYVQTHGQGEQPVESQTAKLKMAFGRAHSKQRMANQAGSSPPNTPRGMAPQPPIRSPESVAAASDIFHQSVAASGIQRRAAIAQLSKNKGKKKAVANPFNRAPGTRVTHQQLVAYLRPSRPRLSPRQRLSYHQHPSRMEMRSI